MPEAVQIRRYEQLAPYDEKEILRYASAPHPSPELLQLLRECLKECEGAFSGRVCYLRLPIKLSGNVLHLAFAETDSKSLIRHLTGCDEIVLFAATVGLGIDRLIHKHSRLSIARAAMLQAVGTERIEKLCDLFCSEMEQALLREGLHTRPRFSPGYGDLPLEMQRQIAAALNCEKHIGVCLNESLLMSPSKSVTAIVGISKAACEEKTQACALCTKSDCPFRKEETI